MRHRQPPPTPPGPDRRRLLAAVLAAAWLPSARAAAPVLRLGTSTPGGGFALYGETLARVLNAGPAAPLVEAVGTRGTAENLERLRRGDLDVALVQGTAAPEALQAHDGPRALFAMYPSPGLLAVPGDSAARDLLDLRGRRIVWGVPASGLVRMARQVFGALGLDLDRDFDAVYVDQAAKAPEIIIAGGAEALWGAGEGWPGFVRLADAPPGARFLGPDETQRRRILAAHPELQPLTLPAGTYRGMAEAVGTVGVWNLILARPGLPEPDGYRLAAALHRAAGALAAALPQAADTTAASTARAVPNREHLHPGSIRLLAELGLLR